MRPQVLRRKMQDLEKHKYVLAYKAEAYHAELEPRKVSVSSSRRTCALFKVWVTVSRVVGRAGQQLHICTAAGRCSNCPSMCPNRSPSMQAEVRSLREEVERHQAEMIERLAAATAQSRALSEKESYAK